MACGIFLDQGSNLYHLHWQADSYPLYQTGKSSISFFSRNFQFISHRLLPDYIFLYTFILTIRSASLIYFLWFQPGFWRESNVSNTPLLYVHMCVWVTQSSPTLCNPMHYSSPGSSAHGILQARILEWVAVPFSRGSSQPRDRTQVSHIAARFFTVWATRQFPGASFFFSALYRCCPIVFCLTLFLFEMCLCPSFWLLLKLFLFAFVWTLE